MLQTAAVYPETLAILRAIMLAPELRQFNLVGGTALALQIGHRISIDLDLFTYTDFESEKILKYLEVIGYLEVLIDKAPFLQVRLNDVKLDFLKFPYSFVQEYVEIDGVRFAAIENIAIMKLLAIGRRGAKKDFFDLYSILEQYPFEDIVQYFSVKIPHVDMFHILKSLTYFADAETDGDPVMLHNVSWAKVKKTIIQKTQAFLKK